MFGGAFNQQQQQSQPAFGAGNAFGRGSGGFGQQSQPAFGGGFAAGSTGFGSSGAGQGFGSTSGGFGAAQPAFGTSQQPGFGQTGGFGGVFGQQQTQQPAFGAPQQQSLFGAPTSTNFGAPSTGFGQPQQQQSTGFGSGGFGAQAGQQQQGFGMQAGQQAGFGGQMGQQSGFGGSSTGFGGSGAFGGSGNFGASAGSGFGGGFGGAQTGTGFGSSGGFGGQTGFGAQQQSQSAFGSGGFGAKTSTGFGGASSGFGASATSGGFGQASGGLTSQTSTGFGPSFGKPQTTTGFGAQQGSFGSGFGSTSGGFGGQTGIMGTQAGMAQSQRIGTKHTPYQATKDDLAGNIKFASLTAMPAYKSSSLEELRFEDLFGRSASGGTAGAPMTTPASGTGTGFGGLPSSQTSFSTSGFGSFSGLGQSQPSTSLFGAGTTQASKPSVSFGTSTTFGAPTSLGTTGFGGFGATAPGGTSAFGTGASSASSFTTGLGTTGGGLGLGATLGGGSSFGGTSLGGGSLFGQSGNAPSTAFGAQTQTSSLFSGGMQVAPSGGQPSFFGSAPTAFGQSFSGMQTSGSTAPVSGPMPEYVILDRPVKTTAAWYDTAFGTKRPVHHTKDIQVRVDAGLQNQLPPGYDPYGIHRLKQIDSDLMASSTTTDTAPVVSEEQKEKERLARLQRFAYKGISDSSRRLSGGITLLQPREASPRKAGSEVFDNVEPQIPILTPSTQSFSGVSLPNAKDLYPDGRTASVLWKEEGKSYTAEEKKEEKETSNMYATAHDAVLSPSIEELINMRKAGDNLERIPLLNLQVKDKIYISWENADLSMLADYELKPLERKLKQGLRFLPGKVFEFKPPSPLCDLATNLSVYVGENADANELKKVCESSGTNFIAVENGFWNFKTATHVPL